MILREVVQDCFVDLAVPEYRLIPFEAKAPQPIPDIHNGVLIAAGEQSSARRNNLSRPTSNRANLACGEGTAMAETRKLAAILAADVAGYSRLAGADEERTLARLRALRSDLIDPTIALHHGRVVKRTGDGILIEFRSVVDAVRCAIEVQNGMVERNAGLPPERRIEFRIGIHLGDVVEESDGDLMGDGVNIAARLEGIAEPGTICLSEQAYWQVKSRLDLAVSDLGATQLKNIAEPVRVYSLEVGKAAQAKPTNPTAPKQRSIFLLLGVGIVALLVIAGGIWLAVRPARGPEMSATTPRLSIVVLPFANLSGDPAQDYLADVLTEELTTSLSRISGTFVIARSTAFTYKGKPLDVKQIGRDLGVRYVLEGSGSAPQFCSGSVGPPDRRKQGPIQFLENNPIQSSFWVRFMCPKTRRNWASPSNCKIPSGVQLPPSSRPEAKPHPRPKATAIFRGLYRQAAGHSRRHPSRRNARAAGAASPSPPAAPWSCAPPASSTSMSPAAAA